MKRANIAAESRAAKASKSNRSHDGNGLRSGSSHQEALSDQPSIAEILGGSQSSNDQLSKKMLLTALIALKKGDFTPACPWTCPAWTARSPMSSTKSWS